YGVVLCGVCAHRRHADLALQGYQCPRAPAPGQAAPCGAVQAAPLHLSRAAGGGVRFRAARREHRGKALRPMMRLPEFSYLSPVSVGDAAKLMADHGPEAMLVAGGTDLYPNMKRRQFEPSVLVGLRGIRELRGVRGSSRSGLTIGAGTTLTAVSAHAEIVRHYPGLATAAGPVAGPQLPSLR